MGDKELLAFTAFIIQIGPDEDPQYVSGIDTDGYPWMTDEIHAAQVFGMDSDQEAIAKRLRIDIEDDAITCIECVVTLLQASNGGYCIPAFS